MNFKKPLSLLLIVGLATGIVASDNDTKKSELQKEINTKYYNRIQDDINIKPAFDFHVLCFIASSLAAAIYYADLSNTHAFTPIKEKADLTISLFKASTVTLYFCAHIVATLIRMNNARAELKDFERFKAEQELATLC